LPCSGQPALAGTSSLELEDFVDAKFYCLHVFADGSQQFWIREKTLEFFSTMLSTLSPCHTLCTKALSSETSGEKETKLRQKMTLKQRCY